MISVLVPNYNNAQFLRERFESILDQSYQDYEVIVCDSFSTDGAWKIILEYAARDPRIRAIQVPKAGIYAGWNDCLALARGDFIYMATSDDTMSHNCLELLLSGLVSHPRCGVAMCGLHLIDEYGKPLPSVKNWRSFPAGVYFDKWFDLQHIRLAPLDGVLSATLHCIWHSATQLLVRRSVYDVYGWYRLDVGSIADFEWSIRVGLYENVFYIPDNLATLRVHSGSATVQRSTYSLVDINQKRKLLEDVLIMLQKKDPSLASNLAAAGWFNAFLFQEIVYTMREHKLAGIRSCWRLWRSSKIGFALLFKIGVAAIKGRESVRKVFSDDLIRNMKIIKSDYIVAIPIVV